MTRETALERMLKGAKMCHPDDAEVPGYWIYDSEAELPFIYVWVTPCGSEEIRNMNLCSDFMSKRKGWKEYTEVQHGK
jgi:hypothetical protein